MTAPIAFVDIESDGVRPDRKPWEIAVIRRNPDGAETEWSAFVDIDLGDTPDGFGVKVGGYYDRHPFGRLIAHGDTELLGEQRPPEAVAIDVARLTHGAVVVGINPSFDTHTLELLLRANGLIPAWDYTPLCAKTLAVGLLIGQGLLRPDDNPQGPPWKTADIAEKLRIPLDDERHTALGDARLAMRMFDAVTAGGAR